MPKFAEPTYYGPVEVRVGLTWREFAEERARVEQEAREAFYKNRPGSFTPEQDLIESFFGTRLDWSQLAIDAARNTGVRMRLLGIEGDTVIDGVRTDLPRAQRVITHHIVRPNWVEYMVTARDQAQLLSFRSEFEMEKDVRMIQGTLPIDPPIGETGGKRQSRLGRFLFGNRQGRYVV